MVDLSQANILLVEDEDDIRNIMRAQLQRANFKVDVAVDGRQGIEMIKKNNYQLYVLDWMLPEVSGIEICRHIRGELNSLAPILMVTAKAEPEYIVTGLDAGADDYITKPFEMDVFLARVRAQLRRGMENAKPAQSEEGFEGEDYLSRGGITIDKKRYEVKSGAEKVQLTVSEFKILKGLMEMPGHVFTRKQLVENISGTGVHVVGRTIDTHLVSLRKKLGTLGDQIETIRGIGYRFKEETGN